MFCYQCEQTAGGTGCTKIGVCGKTSETSDLQDLLIHAAINDTATAVETERRRLAALLRRSLVEPLNLLLSQANAYEQTLRTNQNARMAVSVLTN